MTWQLIETAPKDGTWILAYEGPDEENSKSCNVVRWSVGMVYEWMLPGGAWVDGNYGMDEPLEYFPTHWMPLPEAPIAQSQPKPTDDRNSSTQTDPDHLG